MVRRRSFAREEEGENFWPAFTDLASTIALILFVLVLLAYIQNLVGGKNLAGTRARLAAANAQISISERKLQLLQDEAKRTLAEVEVGQTRLKLSEEKLADQERILGESNRELGDLRARLQGIAVLRVDLLQKVKQALEAQLGPQAPGGAPLVTVADNGNIVLNESLVFDVGSAAIKESARPLLGTLAKAFGSILADDAVRDSVDVVMVQGHTDERGTSAVNRELSARRANAVVAAMFEANPTLERSYGAYFAASAFSKFRPVATEKTEASYQRNRRIEVSLVLKDANVRRVIDDYMKR